MEKNKKRKNLVSSLLNTSGCVEDWKNQNFNKNMFYINESGILTQMQDDLIKGVNTRRDLLNENKELKRLM